MGRSTGKLSPCGDAQAKQRLKQADAFLYVAGLVLEEPDDEVLPKRGVSAALSVLGAIAAADAICCARRQEVFRGAEHAQAPDLLEMAHPEGPKAVADFRRLLALKDQAHYQWDMVSQSATKSALKQASRIVDLAHAAVEG